MTGQSKSIAHAVGLVRAAEEDLEPVRTTFRLMRRTVRMRWFESCSDCRSIDDIQVEAGSQPLAAGQTPNGFLAKSEGVSIG